MLASAVRQAGRCGLTAPPVSRFSALQAQRPALASLSHFRSLHTTAPARGGGGHGREHLRPDSGNIEAPETQYFHDLDMDHANKGPKVFKEFKDAKASEALKKHGFSNEGTTDLFVGPGQDINDGLRKNFPDIGDHNDNPGWGRQKLMGYGNADYVCYMEWIFMYLPAFMVCGLCLPGFAIHYAAEDCQNCDMMVKVTGRQWFWVYEVESPTGDDDDEEEDDD